MNQEAFKKGFHKVAYIAPIVSGLGKFLTGAGKLTAAAGKKTFNVGKHTAGLGKKLGVGGTFTAGFLGLDALDIASKAKNWGNRAKSMSMKSPSFYTYRKLPRKGMY
jgi:hypothetical protein